MPTTRLPIARRSHARFRAALAALLTGLVLAACVPMAMFADSSGAGYRGLKSDWGTYVSHDRVNAFCLTPKLRLAIWDFEGHFGRKVVMNSGYRDNHYNSQVGGATNSYHTRCMAADFHIPGVPKSELIAFAMRSGHVGGLGCYPNRNFIHIDVRDRRPGQNRPVTFDGC